MSGPLGRPAGSSAGPGLRADQLLGALIRRSAPYAGAAGAACLLWYLISSGTAAAAGALLGLVMVAFFFGIDLLVLRLTRESPGAVTVGALMGEYLLKVVLLAAVLWVVATTTELDLQPMAVTVVITTVAGAAAVTIVAMRVRSFTFDFPSDDA